VETFKLLYRSKFIQNNVYHILSELTGFCGRYDKNILVCSFLVHSVYYSVTKASLCGLICHARRHQH